jgi:hypothetical protein
MLNKFCLIFLSVIFLASCNDAEKNFPDAGIPSIANKDTATSAPTAQHFERDSIREIDNFKIQSPLPIIDSLAKLLENDQTASVDVKKDFCWGDCCAIRKLIKTKNAELYIYKISCGEYGFGNEQYYFEGKELKAVRIFDNGIAEFPTDSTPTIHSTQENIYEFLPGSITLHSRSLRSSRQDYDLDTIPYRVLAIESKTLKDSLKLQFFNLAELENTKEQ